MSETNPIPVTVKELKERLAMHGLPVSGKKAELIERLQAHEGVETTISLEDEKPAVDAFFPEDEEKTPWWRSTDILTYSPSTHSDWRRHPHGDCSLCVPSNMAWLQSELRIRPH